MINPPTDSDSVGDGLRIEGVPSRLEKICDYEPSRTPNCTSQQSARERNVTK
jgi:hypothetical protein